MGYGQYFHKMSGVGMNKSVRSGLTRAGEFLRFHNKVNMSGPSAPSHLPDYYQAHPEIEVVETNGKHRLNPRRNILNLVPKRNIGAEIGVFTGLFSEVLVEETEPMKLFLVDPWEKLHGSHFPNWGAYTSQLSIETKAIREAAQYRAQCLDCDCEIVVDFAESWLSKYKEPFLDWVYLDANHKYNSVLRDLVSIDRVLKPGGMILGDDCWVNPSGRKSDVFYSISDFSREYFYNIIRLDAHGQWAMVRVGKTR